MSSLLRTRAVFTVWRARARGSWRTNGPDVHVYLVAADDATDNKSVMNARFIDLGSIKGNIGDQNYTLGSDADLSKYRAVSVWCKRFSVNFGTAALSADRVAHR